MSTEIPEGMICIWLDILSIPQTNRGVQQFAVDSLYVYASSVSAVIIIAPDSEHENTKENAGLDSYKSRVWTRVEQVSHCFAHGCSLTRSCSNLVLQPRPRRMRKLPPPPGFNVGVVW